MILQINNYADVPKITPYAQNQTKCNYYYYVPFQLNKGWCYSPSETDGNAPKIGYFPSISDGDIYI